MEIGKVIFISNTLGQPHMTNINNVNGGGSMPILEQIISQERNNR
jgi:hypothetical protein